MASTPELRGHLSGLGVEAVGDTGEVLQVAPVRVVPGEALCAAEGLRHLGQGTETAPQSCDGLLVQGG